jgi:hypothetical protein
MHRCGQAKSKASSRYGWKGKSQSDMHGNETGADRSDVIEHKYLSVSHSAS